MNSKLRAIVLLCVALVGCSLSAAQQPDILNSVERLEDGWMKITGGDPFVTFNCANIELSKVKAVRFLISGMNVRNRHSYTEFFWATDAHGYTEEYKGFFIAPYAIRSGGEKKVVVNFDEFTKAIGETGNHLQWVRIDFDKSISTEDFRFKCTMELLPEIPQKTKDEVAINLHPPYLSRYLFKADLFAYTMKNLVADFFTRLFRDWLFLILYMLMLGLAISGIRAFGKRSTGALE